MLNFNYQNNISKRKRMNSKLHSQRLLVQTKGSMPTPRILLSRLDGKEPMCALDSQSNSPFKSTENNDSKAMKRFSSMGPIRGSQIIDNNLLNPLDLFRQSILNNKEKEKKLI